MQQTRLTPINDALIARIRDRIVEACHPQAVYLFGSAARGELREGSDLDLLVVMDLPDSQKTWQKASELGTLFHGWLVPLDIVVQTPTQFERGQWLPGFVARTAMRHGKLLYERGGEHE